MYDYDLLVCGGGSAGYATALYAARGGLKVGLVEMMGELGGILTAGNIYFVMGATADSEILRDIHTLGTIFSDNNEEYMVDGEFLKLYFEQQLLDAGVKLHYFTRVCGAETENGKITSVTVLDKEGFRRITARAYADCTGDGDLAMYAGAGYEYGMDGQAQPMSFVAVITGLEREKIREYIGNLDGPYRPEASEKLLAALRQAGVEPTYPKPLIHEVGDGVYNLSINHQYLCGLRAEDITKATVDGRREVFRAVEALRSLGGSWEHIRIVRTPTVVGSREGRRIHGKYTVTAEDMITGKKWENAACRVTFNVDIHTKAGYENGGVTVQPYDVPMEALESRDFDNLYMAGRDISGDFYAHASYRVTGNTFTMGESLGRYLAKALG